MGHFFMGRTPTLGRARSLEARGKVLALYFLVKGAIVYLVSG